METALAAAAPFPDAGNVFALPVVGKWLLWAPLHGVAALVNGAALRQVRRRLLNAESDATGPAPGLPAGLEDLAMPIAAPRAPSGPMAPALLGLIPTRACNLACKYCGFWQAGADRRHMTEAIARTSLEWYFGLLTRAEPTPARPPAHVHFFGGEPFVASEVVEFVVRHARDLAQCHGLTVRFEATTNGAYPIERAHWVANHIDTVMLSLDGPAGIHDHHRPAPDGTGSFPRVMATARVLSHGPAELCLRACVTSETVGQVEAIAAWFCDELRPQAISFETLQPTAEAEAAGLRPPDPWQFAGAFVRAAYHVAPRGVRPVYASADISARRVSFCCPARDVPVVAPDGSIGACYLLEHDWQAAGLDLRLGQVEPESTVALDLPALERTRALNVIARARCDRCFCRWHCAGGCHVNHPPRPDLDRLCIQTRVVALGHLLGSLGYHSLALSILDATTALEQAVLQPSDCLIDMPDA